MYTWAQLRYVAALVSGLHVYFPLAYQIGILAMFTNSSWPDLPSLYSVWFCQRDCRLIFFSPCFKSVHSCSSFSHYLNIICTVPLQPCTLYTWPTFLPLCTFPPPTLSPYRITTSDTKVCTCSPSLTSSSASPLCWSLHYLQSAPNHSPPHIHIH